MDARSLRGIAGMAMAAVMMQACVSGEVPASPGTTQPVVETLARFPHGAFLENLTVAPDQTVFFTSYFDKSIMALPASGEALSIAKLDAYPAGIIRTRDSFIITAHAVPFIKAPDFLSSNEILVLGLDGRVKQKTPAPDARFLNGLVQVGPDRVLIADSVAGCIWAYTPSTGAVGVWLRDATLAPDAAATTFRPGANGLKLHRGAVYVSNTSRGALYRIPLDRSGNAAGAPVEVARTGPIDDFTILPSGQIYATTHGARLLRIAPDGVVSTVLESGCDSCTSVAQARRHGGPQLIVLTTGNFFEGEATPARVLAISVTH